MLVMLLMAVAENPAPLSASLIEETCVPQPMPRAIDYGASHLVGSQKIEFAATPMLESPGGAWVIRVWRRGQGKSNIEILKLRRQLDCNRYDVENRWKSLISQEEYESIASKMVALGIPPPSAFIPPYDRPDMILDGVSIDLRLRNFEWQVERSLNLVSGSNALLISKTFRDLAIKYVPAEALPSEYWRAP